MAKIVIVGGGIGGLATALAVVRHGHRVVVLERADRFGEIGAGIQLAPNGIHALERLGLGEEVRARAVNVDELRFMDGLTDEHVVSMPLTESYRRRFGNPYVVVHRAELHTLLLDACRASPLVELRGGSTAAGYEQDPVSASVVLTTGERVTGDAVVGADGINSALRRQLVGDGEPRVSGITVYRAIIPMDRVPRELRWNAVTWWAGPRCHFVHYPIAGGRYLNLAASSDDGVTEAFAGVPAAKARVRREFAVLGPTPRRLLELGTDWKTWVLVDREPVDVWTDRRVTLLGDAAHPMLHYAAQGACMGWRTPSSSETCSTALPTSWPGGSSSTTRRGVPEPPGSSGWQGKASSLWHPAGERAKARNQALSSMSATDLHDYVAWMHGARQFDSPAVPA